MRDVQKEGPEAGRLRTEESHPQEGEQEEHLAQPPAPGPELPLRSNRSYHLMWFGTTSSEIGLNLSNIAFPLLALSVTGSPAVAGAIGAVNALAQVLVGLPAGALVDRWDRKKIMVSCLLVRGVMLAVMTAAVAAGRPAVWLMLLTAAVAGGASSLFDPAEHASLPLIVTRGQLPTALSVNNARMHLGQLVGTAGGGFLFGVGRAVPFLADAVAHFVALLSLSFVKLPKRPRGREPLSLIHRDIAAGFAFLWNQRFLRSSTLLLLGLNFLFQVLYLVVIVAAERSGTPAAQVGAMAAMFGCGGILGAVVAPRIYRAFGPHQALAGIMWLFAAIVPVMALSRGVVVWGLLLAAMAFMAPTAYTVLGTQQVLLTPDDMRGRLSSATNLFNGGALAGGTAVGGILSQWLTHTQALVCCAVAVTALAITAAVSRSLRMVPDTAPAPDTEHMPAPARETEDSP